MSVVVKKEEKVAAVFSAMSNPDDVQEFKTKFKEMYPKDWKHIVAFIRRRNVLI